MDRHPDRVHNGRAGGSARTRALESHRLCTSPAHSVPARKRPSTSAGCCGKDNGRQAHFYSVVSRDTLYTDYAALSGRVGLRLPHHRRRRPALTPLSTPNSTSGLFRQFWLQSQQPWGRTRRTNSNARLAPPAQPANENQHHQRGDYRYGPFGHRPTGYIK